MRSLEGVRVVDLTRALAGPFCAMTLGDLGADVIKVEEPGTGDDSRHWGPPFQRGESAYFLSCNRNKRGITLNLKRDGGREALWRLIEEADVLIENFRPGLMTRLGFGYDDVLARNPRLIYCSISGFGQEGPEANRPGYDIILQGMSGVTSITGDPNGSPYRCGLPICDILAGMFAAQGILAALLARQQTGRGQRVETTLLRATVAPRAELLAGMAEAGVPAGPIRDLREVSESPQAQFLGLAVTQEHPTSGTIRTVRPAIGLSETPAEVRLPPPTLGQHTNEVLGALGYDDETIARWHAEGTV